MAEQAQDKEPTMEEILASIRRIISEDDENADGEAGAADAEIEAVTPAAQAPVSVEDAPAPAEDAVAEAVAADDEPIDDVLDLTQTVADESEPILADAEDDVVVIDTADEPLSEPQPEPEPEPAPEPAPIAAASPAQDDSIVSEPVATATAGAFGSLISNLLVSSRTGEGKTLEDLVAELLRPMLKDWLDANLRDIVEARVADEVEKISSRARR